jgi:hypothetical protein
MRALRLFFAAGAGLLPLLLAQDAQAAPPACATGGLGGQNAYSVTLLQQLGSTGCVIGDKVYSDFSFTNLASGIFTFSVSGVDHTFSGSGLNFTGSSFSYDYKVALYNPVPGQEFIKFNTSAGGSNTTNTLDFTKTLTALSITSTDTEDTTGTIANFPSGTVGQVAFSGALTRTGGKIDTISDSLSQKIGDNVPSPLPVLGAGVAFAASRRLRRRIKFAC